MRARPDFALAAILAAASIAPSLAPSPVRAFAGVPFERSKIAEDQAAGAAVAVDGDWAVVGMPEESPPTPSASAGRVVFYRRDESNPGRWTRTQEFAANDGAPCGEFEPGDLLPYPDEVTLACRYFGVGVAVSGQTAAALYPASALSFYGSPSPGGALYVYERGEDDVWSRSDHLFPFLFELDTPVALASDTLAAGPDVFEREPSGWTHQGIVEPAARVAHSSVWHISAVDLSDDLIVQGYPHASTAAGETGALYLFDRDALVPEGWAERPALAPPEVVEGDRFGASVALDGDVLLVSAPGDESVWGCRGAVYVYETPDAGASWELVRKLSCPFGEGGSYGGKLALHGDRAVVAGEREESRLASGRGPGVFPVLSILERDHFGESAWGAITVVPIGPEPVAAVATWQDVVVAGIPSATRSGLLDAGEALHLTDTPFCGDDELLEPEACDDGNLRSGDGCSARCALESHLAIAGTAQGGELDVVIAGVPVSVETTAGRNESQVSEALVAAIEASEAPELEGIGATVDPTGHGIWISGVFSEVAVDDPGLRTEVDPVRTYVPTTERRYTLFRSQYWQLYADYQDPPTIEHHVPDALFAPFEVPARQFSCFEPWGLSGSGEASAHSYSFEEDVDELSESLFEAEFTLPVETPVALSARLRAGPGARAWLVLESTASWAEPVFAGSVEDQPEPDGQLAVFEYSGWLGAGDYRFAALSISTGMDASYADPPTSAAFEFELAIGAVPEVGAGTAALAATALLSGLRRRARPLRSSSRRRKSA